MKNLAFLLLAVITASTVFGDIYECTVTNGGYASPGSTKLVDAIERDGSIEGKKFQVDRNTGKITGNSLFENEGEKIEVIRDIDESINVYVLASTNRKGDIDILSIKEIDGSLTFRYYNEYMGLYLIGTCKKL